MSNCKTCNQPISWDQKRRDELGTKRPLNMDMTIHQCGGNGDIIGTGKPESISRPKEFVGQSNNNNVQVKEQQIEQLPALLATASAIYPYSLKAEMNAKGLVLVTCHVYNSDIDKAREDCVKLFTETVTDLKVKGVKVLEA